MADADLVADILTGCRIADRLGLVQGFGHISARREDGSIYLTARKALRLVQAEDLVVLDLEGRSLAGGTAPPLEWPAHAEIYRARPDVGAICRTHSPWVRPFAAALRSIRVVHGFGACLGPEVPVFNHNDLVHTPAAGAEMARFLGQRVAVLFRGNGAIVTGATVRHAVALAAFLEESARTLYLASLWGEPPYYSDEEIERRWQSDAQHEPLRAWEYYASLVGE